MSTVATVPMSFLKPASPSSTDRWAPAKVEALFEIPLLDLLLRAQQIHREFFAPNEVQLSTLLSIKTGGCSEDCGYCPQSAHFDAGVRAGKLLAVEQVVDAAREARRQGATRFCMGAAWREPKSRDMAALVSMVQQVKALGIETCMTLGMLNQAQAAELAQAGLDYYNHNLDTAPDYYGTIVSTRSYQDRLQTLENVRGAGMRVCCGGIVGMGESRSQRAALIAQLANLDPYPESVPINRLVAVSGTPLEHAPALDPFEFVRTIAAARITMPRTMVRLSAGREQMAEELQVLCFLAGANSIFYGSKLLTTSNPQGSHDLQLLERVGLRVQASLA